MKGQQDVVSAILISGILIGVVGSVYYWGVPLIEKNQDISTLKSSEDFMRLLNDKIKFVANNGGSDRLRIDVPGILEFQPDGIIELTVDTKGSIYAAEAEIPLTRNECSRIDGTFGTHDPSSLCVRSRKIADKSYTTTYTLRFINLNVVQSGVPTRVFKINLQGVFNTGAQNRYVVVQNTGSSESTNTVLTNIAVKIE